MKSSLGGQTIGAVHARRRGLAADNAADPLTIPTYIEGNDEIVHPDVVDAGPGGWNGYRWWLAATPYPDSNNFHENPCIWASHDRLTWVVPPGGSNPVEPAPGLEGQGYNSDPDIVLHDGTMYLFWRTFFGSEYIRLRTSPDGITWTAKQNLIVNNVAESRPCSPAVVRDADGTWRMWCIDILLNGDGLGGMVMFTADDPEGPWSAAVDCDLLAPTGKELWHLDVHAREGVYHALVMVTNVNASGAGGQLYAATSTDGETWERDAAPLLIGRPGQWDPNIYRATWLQRGPLSNLWDIWYSALAGPQGWAVGHTTIAR